MAARTSLRHHRSRLHLRQPVPPRRDRGTTRGDIRPHPQVLTITSRPIAARLNAPRGTSNASLNYVSLQHAKPRDFMLFQGHMRHAKPPYADLRNASLTATEMTGVVLTRASLVNTRLSSSGLSGASFISADPSRAGPWKADLQYASLIGADLSGAELGDADLRRADMTGAHFRGADPRTQTSSTPRTAPGRMLSPALSQSGVASLANRPPRTWLRGEEYRTFFEVGQAAVARALHTARRALPAGPKRTAIRHALDDLSGQLAPIGRRVSGDTSAGHCPACCLIHLPVVVWS